MRRARKLRLTLGSLFLVAVVASASNQASAQAVTKAQAEELSKRIEKSVASADPSVFSASFDGVAFMGRALQGTDITPNERVQVMNQVGDLGGQFGRQIIANTQGAGSYKLVRIRETGAEACPIFRVLGSNGTLNYNEMHLAVAANGQIKIVDIDSYVTGEPLSQTIHRAVIPLLAQAHKGMLARLMTGESDYVTHQAEIKQFQAQVVARQFPAARATYDAFPDSVKKDKTLMLLHLVAMADGDQAAYGRAIDEYQKTFPNDPGGLLVSLDALTLQHKFPELLANIDALDHKIGGDPILDFYRASAALGAGDTPAAKRFLARLTTSQPWYKNGWFSRVQISLNERDYDQTAALLDEAHTRGGLVWSGVSTAAGYQGFVQSDAYKKWVEHNPQLPKRSPRAPGN